MRAKDSRLFEIAWIVAWFASCIDEETT